MGWRRASTYQWQELEALEPLLAGVDPMSPLYPEAQRLRVAWRIHTGSRQKAEEALQQIDRLIPIWITAEDLILRAQACVAAGRIPSAIWTLEEIAAGAAQPSSASLRRRSLDILDTIPGDETYYGQVDAVRFRLKKPSGSDRL